MSSAQIARLILAVLLVAGAWLLLGDGLSLRLDPDTQVANLVPGRILILLAVTTLALYACPGRCRRSAAIDRPQPVPVPTIEPTTTRSPVPPDAEEPSGDRDNVWSLLGHGQRSTSGPRSLIDHSVHGTTDAICHMLALRDPYTADHLERVGELSAAIAERMGLGADIQHRLRIAGALHDVGKVAVPAEILTRPGPLTPSEFDLVKGHAEAGYQILRRSGLPPPVAEVVRQHHERMDGSGYPRGLRGEEILLDARILAVADMVDSMAAPRPYRPALGLDAALAELGRQAGTSHDTEVAAACLEVFSDRGYHPGDWKRSWRGVA